LKSPGINIRSPNIILLIDSDIFVSCVAIFLPPFRVVRLYTANYVLAMLVNYS
jgi:hypothetical protein